MGLLLSTDIYLHSCFPKPDVKEICVPFFIISLELPFIPKLLCIFFCNVFGIVKPLHVILEWIPPHYFVAVRLDQRIGAVGAEISKSIL